MLDFLKEFITEPVNDNKETRHSFYRIQDGHLSMARQKISIPNEIAIFFKEIGYGFFHNDDANSFDRILSPLQLKQLNLREDFYQFDPDLELYESYPDKLMFLEINEGVYLLIDKEDKEGKNAIYYFDKKIADSLEEFLIRFDKEGHYFEDDELS